MLEEFLTGEGARALLSYLHRPETHLAVVLPGIASLAILGFYARRGRISSRLRLLWLLTLPITYCFARWVVTPYGQELYAYSAFSMLCALLLFKRIYLPPALAFALTFLSLFWVDVTCALCRALEWDLPLAEFYMGVGGAGAHDALLVIPLLTAVMVAYAGFRIRARGEALAEI